MHKRAVLNACHYLKGKKKCFPTDYDYVEYFLNIYTIAIADCFSLFIRICIHDYTTILCLILNLHLNVFIENVHYVI